MFRPAIFAAILMPAAVAGRTEAHALGVECKVHGDRVVLEAYYSDDTAARGAKVAVRDASNELVCQGQTDSDGRWSFPVPAAGQYEVVVDAGLGHRTEVALIIPAKALAAPEIVSSGPPRSEFTRTPWLKILLGLALIAAPGLVLRLWLSRRNAALPPGKKS